MYQNPTRLTATEMERHSVSDCLMQMPLVAALVRRIGPAEVRRRLLHMSPAFVSIGLPAIPHADVWGPVLLTAALLMAALGLAAAIVLTPHVLRPAEKTWMQAVWGYILPIVGALLFFPGRAEVALMTLQLVALGDGSATLGGKLIGGKTLPWSDQKTYAGLACFVAVGTLAATYSFWGEASPRVPLATAFLICSFTALCAGIVESLPLGKVDNWRVGMTSVIVGAVLDSYFL
jgi:dolichol kinase